MHIITYHIIQQHKHFTFIFRCRHLPELQFATSQLADLQIKKGCFRIPFSGERGSRTYAFKKYHKIANH